MRELDLAVQAALLAFARDWYLFEALRQTGETQKRLLDRAADFNDMAQRIAEAVEGKKVGE